jgi:hypothetical protein
MTNYQENDPVKVTECIKKASEHLFAFLYMENADQGKYGSLFKGLSSQKSLGNDQYLRTLSKANNVLSNHKFDGNSNKKHNDWQSKNNKLRDHNKSKNDEAPVLSFAQLEGHCYCCGKKGHRSPDCFHKAKIPKEEWAFNKAQLHAQVSTEENMSDGSASVTSNTTTASEKKPEPRIGWAGVHCSFAQMGNLKYLILIDSDLMDTIFCNPDYVTNIKDTDKSLWMLTNGGPMNCNQRCPVPHLGECWFNKDLITNIIALSDMTSNF